MKKLLMIAFAAASLVACSNYLDEFQDEYEDSFVSVDDPENISSDSHGQTPGDGSKLSSAQTDASSSASIFDASSSNAETGASSSSKKDDEHYDCYMNDSACISEIANEFEKTVRLLDSRNNNVYTAIYVGGLDFETANGYSSIFDDSVSFLLMTENLEYEGESVTALDTNGVFFYTYENAEKACPTGWRLPKITPEWFFLLTGEGHQFNIELPDDEKGCYTNGKFDSGKSIFYWAQKEGETSWFVQKNYLANDHDLHEQERCNTFPVRCVKEFGRYADYAGSSSSSDKTKSSSSAKSSSSSVVSSSSVKSSSSSAKSSSSSVASSSSEVCREYSSQTYAPVTAITFVNEKNYSETMDGIIEDGEYFNPEDSIISTVKKRVVDFYSACKLSSENIQVKSFDDKKFNDNATFESICYNSDIVKVIVREEDFSCIECTGDVFNSECPVAVAAKFLGSSSSSVTGSMLFDANELYMKNGSAINVVGFDSSFADGWMKVAGFLSSSPYISFNTDPVLNAVVGGLPVDISAWGGICMTYASNVNIKVVAHDSKNEAGNEGYVMMSSKFEATTDNQAKSACVNWGSNATSLTSIDQIQLVPVSSSSSDPAVIYIKNISTVKKTDVKIDVDIVKSCRGDGGWDSCDVSKDEQINLSLFESYTVDGLSCLQFDLGVFTEKNEYYTIGNVCTSPDFTENITNIGLRNKTSLGNAADDNLANVENPILTDVSIAGPAGGNFSITFHPKSWYAAPVPSSTSN